MFAAERAGQLSIVQPAAIRRLPDRGLFFNVLYLVAITSAMISWLWLISWLAMRLI